MAKILVRGETAEVEIITVDEAEGELALKCDRGAWCPFPEDLERHWWNPADALAEAERHVDYRVHVHV